MNKQNHSPSPIHHTLTIGWLYPELMSTYGDRGNIIVLTKRCEWRNISVTVKKLNEGFFVDQLRQCDLLFMGGAQDQQQKIVAKDLEEKTPMLRKMIEDGVPGLYICGAYQFLGKYYKEADGVFVEGLDILDLYTENPGARQPRLIGNVAIQPSSVILNLFQDFYSKTMGSFDSAQDDNACRIIGFENHGGRTYLGNRVQPLGKVIKGFGNNGEDGSEGAVYKNSFGSYFHGPILPKNPHFADLLIQLSLEKKYKEKVTLQQLDDDLEWQAHLAALKKTLS